VYLFFTEALTSRSVLFFHHSKHIHFKKIVKIRKMLTVRTVNIWLEMVLGEELSVLERHNGFFNSLKGGDTKIIFQF